MLHPDYYILQELWSDLAQRARVAIQLGEVESVDRIANWMSAVDRCMNCRMHNRCGDE